jgi:tripartite ATP-independent transporter DctP family solute receptor
VQIFKSAILAGALSLTALTGAAEAATVMKLGHLANEQNSWHLAALKFAEEVKARTNGEIEIQVFPNDTLGKEVDLIKGMQFGTVDFTITGETMQNWTPYAKLLAVPYSIRSDEQLKAVVDGPVGQKIAEEVQANVHVIPLTWFARGPRELTSNKPIRNLEDLQGLKMRVPNVPLFVDFWSAIGAKPAPMAFSEVFTGLQSHVIDAQENPLALIRSASFNEVQKYVNMTDHVRSWIYLAVSERNFDRLTPEQQDAIRESAKIAQDYEHELFLKDEQKFRAELEAAGMEFIEVDQQAFAEAGKDAIVQSLGDELTPLYEQMIATK